MQNQREQWLEERRKGLGGSDSPVLVLGNDHPFTTPRQLWDDKMGVATPVDVTPAMQRGTDLEPLIADKYADKTGRTVKVKEDPFIHPKIPYMRGNVDRLIDPIEGKEGPGILEIKCPGSRMFAKIKREGLQEYYQIQLQHYLAVSGYKWGSIAVFDIEKWDMIYYDFDRDDDLIGIIESRCSDFWNNNVMTKTPPEETERIEIKLPKTPKVNDGEEIIDMNNHEGFVSAVESYKEAKELSEEAKDAVDFYAQRIKNLMEDKEAVIAESSGMRFYYKEQTKSSFDKKLLAVDHPEIDLSKYEKKGNPYKSLRPYQIKQK